MIEIELQKINEDRFSRFGECYLVHTDTKFDSSGEGWQCWYPLGVIEEKNNLQIGIVKCQPLTPTIHLMERHKDRVEYLIALDRPIIQTVGLSSTVNPNAPDETQTEAFILYPGQIVKLNAGIWHAVALPFGPEAAQYWFLLGKPDRQNGDPDSGLTGFAGGGAVHIVAPKSLI
jgi:ureidoglycolate hydrolase